MPGTSAKSAEVKLRVPLDVASAIETYAQAHTHGNKTKAYLHFLEAGLNAQSDQAPVTKADLLAVAAAIQATTQRAVAASAQQQQPVQMPALPSAEELAQNIEASVSNSVARSMAETTESVATELAARIPQMNSADKLEESVEEATAKSYQRGFVAGKEAEDRRAIAVALAMNSLMRTVCGGPFIRAFLPDSRTELLAADLPQSNAFSDLRDVQVEQPQMRPTPQIAPAAPPKRRPRVTKVQEEPEVPHEPIAMPAVGGTWEAVEETPAEDDSYEPRHVAMTGEAAGVEPLPLFDENADAQVTGVLPPISGETVTQEG